MIDKYPNENSSDLSPFGQRKINFYGPQKQVCASTTGQKRASASDEESASYSLKLKQAKTEASGEILLPITSDIISKKKMKLHQIVHC